MQFALGRRHVRHVVKGHAHLRFVVTLGRAFDVVAQKAPAQGIAKARQEEKNKNAHQKQHGQEEHEDRADPGAGFRFTFVVDAEIVEALGDIAARCFRDGHVGLDLVVADGFLDVLGQLVDVFGLELAHHLRSALEDDLREVAILGEFHEIRIVDGSGVVESQCDPHDDADQA